jgi:NTP pyrophosphatase (non-canonical NTP hydrolase)
MNDKNDRLQGAVDALFLANAARQLVDASHGAAVASGWWTDTETGEDVRTWPLKFFKLWVGTKIALIHSEASEGLEGYRKDLMDDKLPHRKMLEVELADLMIRACDLAGGLGLDLGGAIVEKLAYNAQRADHKPENRAAAGGKAF